MFTILISVYTEMRRVKHGPEIEDCIIEGSVGVDKTHTATVI